MNNKATKEQSFRLERPSFSSFPLVNSIREIREIRGKKINSFALRSSTAKTIRDNLRNSRQTTSFSSFACVNSIREIRAIRG